ncbi:MAG TPA: ABC transporter substrate-binding protein [Candidatus Limnocylindria bacterium]|nr:ABC transporter substrate-binding protein [Candidatus Limnocylindria bacterium]
MDRSLRVAIPFVVAALVASACGGAGTSGGAKPPITIGSTNFSEQLVLGELYGQILEANGYSVNRKFNLGNREIVFPALQSGQIDMEVDYLATLLAFVDKSATGSTDPKQTAATLQTALTPKGLTVLDHAPAVDQNGFVVTKATADRHKLTKISDLVPVAAQLVLGGPPECPNREFCALGLKSKYGITFKEFKPLDVGGPLTVQALVGGQIDVALLFTSDATIAVRGFVLLEDDKQLQLSDNVAPVVRNEYLAKAGDDFKRIVNSIAPKLTTAELTGMNKLVEIDKKDPKDVAKEWLKKQGLIR